MTYASETAQRPRTQYYAPRESRAESHPRKAFHKSHTALGATGHWIREAGILAPLVISEFVKDADKRWRYIRMASVATALLSEGLWSARIHSERKEREARDEVCPQMMP